MNELACVSSVPVNGRATRLANRQDGVMNDLQPYAMPSPMEQRRLGRDLAQLAGQTSRAIARVQASAELEATKVDAIAYVAQRAMTNVGLLSEFEHQLATAVPMASGRLATIGDFAALGMAQLVANTARRVGG